MLSQGAGPLPAAGSSGSVCACMCACTRVSAGDTHILYYLEVKIGFKAAPDGG